MAYKVSYKVLRQQGEDIKAAAKLLDGYAERIGQIRGRLGSDELLSQVRGNLQKLQGQLGESRAILNTAGEFLLTSVEGYSGVEVRQVKKVDGARAHNRDFYKNPVVVASAGGAAAAGAVSAPPVTASTTQTTVNYTDNSVNVAYTTMAAAPAAAEATVQVTAPAPAAVQTVAAEPVSAAADTPLKVGGTGIGGIAAGALGGAAAASGAIAGGMHLKKKRDDARAADAEQGEDAYDPEAELERAIQRVRALEQADEEDE